MKELETLSDDDLIYKFGQSCKELVIAQLEYNKKHEANLTVIIAGCIIQLKQRMGNDNT